MHEWMGTLLGLVSPTLACELGAHERELEAAREAGSAAHPTLSVPPQAWAHYLARHLQEGDLTTQLEALRAADVHLTLACLTGSPHAHARLDQRLRAVLPQALAGIRVGTIPRDELLQLVRAKLLVGPDGGEGKLGSYAGRGPLDGWLRVVTARTALSLLRAGRANAAPPFDEELGLNVADVDDPQLAVLRSQATPMLKRALDEALAAMPADARTLLRLHHLDGLGIDDLAPLYQAHRATLARRLAKARNDLLEHARKRARELLGISEAELSSLMGVMISQLDLTLQTALERAPSER